MGLMQRAVETYDNLPGCVGKLSPGDREPFAPVSHIVAEAKINITINAGGQFVSAEEINKKIIIPVTEKSAGRTSAVAAHGLCDQIGYIMPDDPKKYSEYLDQLREWCSSKYSHPKAEVVLHYVEQETVKQDLEEAGLLKIKDGKVENTKDMVCWTVVGMGESGGPVWTDQSIMDSWTDFYINHTVQKNGSTVCYVSGDWVDRATQHLKGVVASNGNAKLISANDNTNFTYRGRFEQAEEAASIGYQTSQKAHNALKWLVANHGMKFENRTFICWNPNGKPVPSVNSPLFFGTDHDEVLRPDAYEREISKKIEGYKVNLPNSELVVIASFDAATSGRLSLSYYNELRGSDFLDRLEYWDTTCCWYDNGWGTQSPLLFNIIKFAYGTQRKDEENARIEVDSRIVGPLMQQLLFSRIDKALFPVSMMVSIKHHADNLQIYSSSNRRSLLFTACAVIRKYRIDHYREVWKMALEPNRKDRSYQFGRLLAVLEKAERDTYDDDSSARETNAIRMQQVYVQRPGYALKIIMERVKTAYYPKLKESSRGYYEKLIGEIMEQISRFPENEYDKKLSETYLLGYYLQKNELYSKKSEKSEMNEEEK
mgnify:FL=1